MISFAYTLHEDSYFYNTQWYYQTNNRNSEVFTYLLLYFIQNAAETKSSRANILLK